ncbi:hypothetical protein SAMN05216599_11931 [Pseudomonas cichorii]|nr:hypothetical protein SAMN05216599_11931 [Pseudomonas cichorii]
MTFNYDHIQYGHYKCNGIRQREVVANPWFNWESHLLRPWILLTVMATSKYLNSKTKLLYLL